MVHFDETRAVEPLERTAPVGTWRSSRNLPFCSLTTRSSCSQNPLVNRAEKTFSLIYYGSEVDFAMPFSHLGLSPEVVEGVKAMGYVEPTPIQLRAIPLILSGRDVIRQRPNRHRQNRGLRPAHPYQSRRSTQHDPRAGPGTHPRTRRPGRNRHARFCAVHQLERRRHLRRRWLWQADASSQNGVDILVATPGRLLDHM